MQPGHNPAQQSAALSTGTTHGWHRLPIGNHLFIYCSRMLLEMVGIAASGKSSLEKAMAELAPGSKIVAQADVVRLKSPLQSPSRSLQHFRRIRPWVSSKEDLRTAAKLVCEMSWEPDDADALHFGLFGSVRELR